MLFASIDDLRLHYEEAGSGGIPLLLVPGWTGTVAHFSPQVAHFSADRRVVAVDPRGHGESDKPDGEYTVAALADDLAAFCAAVDLDRPVVIGHAAGGAVAMELAARHPGLARALVLLEAPVFVPEPVRAAVAPVLDALEQPGFRDVHRQLFSRLFGPDDTGPRQEMIRASVDTCPQHVLAPLLRSISSWDTGPAAERVDVPLLLVRSDRSTPPDVEQLAAACRQLVTAETVGAGHFVQIFAAEQVNAMVDRFLETALPSPTPEAR